MSLKSDISQARLRAYLTAKARAGRFDPRMCAYYKVSPRVNIGCKRAICRAFVAGLVPTSTTGGHHAPGSYHGKGRAVDFGLRQELVGTTRGMNRLKTFQRKEYWRARHNKLHPVELIGPINALVILQGRVSPLQEGAALENQHDTHVHEAY